MNSQHLLFFLLLLLNLSVFGQTNKVQTKVERINKKANKCVEKGATNKAITLYSNSVLLDSLNAETFFARGKVYALEADHIKAVLDFNKAIILKPNKGGLYWERGSSFVSLKDYGRGLADFEKGITLVDTPSIDQWEEIVACYLQLYRIADALPYLNELIIRYPESEIYYIQRATCYLALGELKEMHKDLIRLDELEDTSNDHYKLETLFHMSTKNLALAIESARKNIKSTKDAQQKAEGYQLLSNVYYSIQYRDSAMANINRAIQLDPQAAYYYDRGCYHADAGEIEPALEDFNATILKDSTHIGAYNNRTFYIWFPSKNFENAIEDLSKIIKLDSLNAFAFSNRSYAYYGLQQFDLAYKDALISFDLEPKNPYLYKNMALIYFALGDEIETQSMIQNALDWGFPAQTDPEFLFLLDHFKIPSP